MRLDVLADTAGELDVRVGSIDLVGLAAFAGPEPGLFGDLWEGEEQGVFSFGFAGRAGGTAVDGGGLYSVDEFAVLGGVALEDGVPKRFLVCGDLSRDKLFGHFKLQL